MFSSKPQSWDWNPGPPDFELTLPLSARCRLCPAPGRAQRGHPGHCQWHDGTLAFEAEPTLCRTEGFSGCICRAADGPGDLIWKMCWAGEGLCQTSWLCFPPDGGLFIPVCGVILLVVPLPTPAAPALAALARLVGSADAELRSSGFDLA